MVKVDLLKPEPGRVKKAVTFNLGSLQKILYSLIIVSFFGGGLLMFYTYYQKKNLTRISSQYLQAQNLREEMKAFTQKKDKLTNGISLLSGYLKREIIWSGKLTQMRSVIPAEVWLTKLSLEKKSGLASFYLSGGLIAKGNLNPIGVLSNFVNKLKADKEFSVDFDKPVLTDLRSEIKNNVEIMVFTIEMPLNKEKTG